MLVVIVLGIWERVVIHQWPFLTPEAAKSHSAAIVLPMGRDRETSATPCGIRCVPIHIGAMPVHVFKQAAARLPKSWFRIESWRSELQ